MCDNKEQSETLPKISKGVRYYYRHREEILEQKRQKKLEDPEYQAKLLEKERKKAEKAEVERLRAEKRELRKKKAEQILNLGAIPSGSN